MGYGGWDSVKYTKAASARKAAGKSTFDHSSKISSGAIAATVHELLDPSSVAGAASPFVGRVMREVCITDEHPNPTPLALVLDVTGSNFDAAKAVHAKLPQLFGVLQRTAGIEDPQVLMGAIGDAYSDRVPLQMGHFESDNRIDAQVEAMYLEGNGGGQRHETYELAAYFLARHTHLEPWHKQGRKGYCNTPDAPIWMADQTFQPIGKLEPGDEVMGWDHVNGYRSLAIATVLGTKHRIADNVVEVTMESGNILRCTSDHRWLSYWHGSSAEDIWTHVLDRKGKPAMLASIIEPVRSLPENLREDAAWLAGIYDGEGSGSAITQHRDHNPDVCDRIETVLDRLGFKWVYRRNRDFHFLGGLQTYVQMLNWLPITRRQQLLNKILLSNWFKYKNQEVRGKTLHRHPDRVASVRPLPPQEVVSLQTSTGNYVAWGYASSNCIFIGDEMPYDMLCKEFDSHYGRGHTVESLIGDKLQADIPTAEVFEELKEQYEVFFLFQEQGAYSEAQIMGPWRDLLGENAVVLENPDNVCEFIAGLLAMREGGLDLDDVAGALTDAGFDKDAIASVSKTLAVVGAGSGGPVAKTDGSLSIDSGGADRL